MRYDEVAAGSVDHAIRVTAACTYDAYLWPARHAAGTNDRRCPPMGARFRLKAGFDASRFGPQARVVLRAMKHYGVIVADNGSDWYFQGTVDPGGPTPSSTSSSGSLPGVPGCGRARVPCGTEQRRVRDRPRVSSGLTNGLPRSLP